jgi:hypothetical protein
VTLLTLRADPPGAHSDQPPRITPTRVSEEGHLPSVEVSLYALPTHLCDFIPDPDAIMWKVQMCILWALQVVRRRPEEGIRGG